MTIAKVIDQDIERVSEYCTRLIAFADASPTEFATRKPRRGKLPTYLPINIPSLVRRDLIANIYSLLDFRLKSLCHFHHQSGRIQESFAEFKSKDRSKSSDLARFKKYFQVVGGFDLQVVQASYKHLDVMRRIRNAYMHNGGEADEDAQKLVAELDGVTVEHSLISVSEAYIYECIHHAAAYLRTIAQANPSVNTASFGCSDLPQVAGQLPPR